LRGGISGGEVNACRAFMALKVFPQPLVERMAHLALG
jgi:hypothetical protein